MRLTAGWPDGLKAYYIKIQSNKFGIRSEKEKHIERDSGLWYKKFMKTLESIIKCGDCAKVLLDYPDNFFDLIVTSPPYADCRVKTYGGIRGINEL